MIEPTIVSETGDVTILIKKLEIGVGTFMLHLESPKHSGAPVRLRSASGGHAQRGGMQVKRGRSKVDTFWLDDSEMKREKTRVQYQGGGGGGKGGERGGESTIGEMQYSYA